MPESKCQKNGRLRGFELCNWQFLHAAQQMVCQRKNVSYDIDVQKDIDIQTKLMSTW